MVKGGNEGPRERDPEVRLARLEAILADPGAMVTMTHKRLHKNWDEEGSPAQFMELKWRLLLKVLVNKGVLTEEEAAELRRPAD